MHSHKLSRKQSGKDNIGSGDLFDRIPEVFEAISSASREFTWSEECQGREMTNSLLQSRCGPVTIQEQIRIRKRRAAMVRRAQVSGLR